MVDHRVKHLHRHGNPEVLQRSGPRRVHLHDDVRFASVVECDDVPSEDASERAKAAGISLPQHPLDGSQSYGKGGCSTGHETAPGVLVPLLSKEANELLPLLDRAPVCDGVDEERSEDPGILSRACA